MTKSWLTFFGCGKIEMKLEQTACNERSQVVFAFDFVFEPTLSLCAKSKTFDDKRRLALLKTFNLFL